MSVLGKGLLEAGCCALDGPAFYNVLTPLFIQHKKGKLCVCVCM